MGSYQSVQVDEDQEEEENEDDEDVGHHVPAPNRRPSANHAVNKVLEQEPEALPCHASASPLSPQLSSLGTPRLGPSIKVWDPYNVLAPPPPPPLPPLPPPPPQFSRSSSSCGIGGEDRAGVTEVVLISHGECGMSLRPELVAGRCPDSELTVNGKRQARALAVFLKSQGLRFSAVYSSPLDRARETAVSVCQEMGFAEEQIRSAEALVEMSEGHWEGCLRSEIHTPEILSFIDRFQPDFCAPSGESLRQVEFRMLQFLNGTVLGLHEKLRSDYPSLHQNDSPGFPNHNSHSLINSVHVHDREGGPLSPVHWDGQSRSRQGFSRKKSGKSRLQYVTTTSANGDRREAEAEAEAEVYPWGNGKGPLEEATDKSSSVSTVGLFTHSVPIKCLITGLLGCSPAMSHKICIDDSSVTVLQHTWNTGWQIKRLNDTAHLGFL